MTNREINRVTRDGGNGLNVYLISTIPGRGNNLLNYGSPFDQRTSDAVYADMRAAGIETE